MANNGASSSMWGGRFSENPDEFMVEFGASIDIDIELLDADIDGSKAWVGALLKAGILAADEAATIRAGLDSVRNAIKSELSAGTFAFDRSLEDIHMTVESRLTGLIGDAGARLHTGRSRNDQVALDERLYLLGALDRLNGMILNVQRAVCKRAVECKDAFVPSYTHLQQALPVRLGHYLMAWFWMLERDRDRLTDARKRTDSMPLGSGAVAGSGFPVDREFIARELGFSRVTENSVDAVSDRDYFIETLAAASILMMHLSRISEDLIIWSSAEFGFVRLPDRYSTGSSMMPQKKNPDSLELVRGKTGRVYGALVSLLTIMKGLPFSYGKDMQEDKEPLFDTLKTLDGCLRIMAGVIEGSAFDTARMEKSIDDVMFATDVADYLTAKGLPFRKAHEVAGRLVRWAGSGGIKLSAVPLAVMKEHSDLFEADVKDIFDLGRSTDRRSVIGGTGKEALERQFERAKTIIDSQNT